MLYSRCSHLCALLCWGSPPPSLFIIPVSVREQWGDRRMVGWYWDTFETPWWCDAHYSLKAWCHFEMFLYLKEKKNDRNAVNENKCFNQFMLFNGLFILTHRGWCSVRFSPVIVQPEASLSSSSVTDRSLTEGLDCSCLRVLCSKKYSLFHEGSCQKTQ